MLREKTGEGKGKVSPHFFTLNLLAGPSFCFLSSLVPLRAVQHPSKGGTAEVGAIIGRPGLKGGGGGACNWRFWCYKAFILPAKKPQDPRDVPLGVFDMMHICMDMRLKALWGLGTLPSYRGHPDKRNV